MVLGSNRDQWKPIKGDFSFSSIHLLLCINKPESTARVHSERTSLILRYISRKAYVKERSTIYPMSAIPASGPQQQFWRISLVISFLRCSLPNPIPNVIFLIQRILWLIHTDDWGEMVVCWLRSAHGDILQYHHIPRPFIPNSLICLLSCSILGTVLHPHTQQMSLKFAWWWSASPLTNSKPSLQWRRWRKIYYFAHHVSLSERLRSLKERSKKWQTLSTNCVCMYEM